MAKKEKQESIVGKKIEHLERMRLRKKMQNPIWKLSLEAVEQIEEAGFPCQEREYIAETKKLEKLNYKTPDIIQQLHYAYINGHQFVIRRYTEDDKEILRKHGITFEPYNYEIRLDQYMSQ